MLIAFICKKKKSEEGDSMWKKIKSLIDMPMKKYVLRQAVCLLFMLIYTVTSLAFPCFISIIIDKGVALGNNRTIIIYSLLMLGVGGIMIAFQNLQRLEFYKFAQEIILKLKEKLMTVILSTNLSFWSRNKVGDIFTILENDVSQIETLLTTTVSDILVNTLVIIGISSYLLYTDKYIGVIVIILALVFSVFQRKIGEKVKADMYKLRNEVGILSSYTSEILNNVNNIQVSGYKKLVLENYNVKNKNVITYSINQIRTISFTQLVGASFNVLGIFVVLIIGAYRVNTGTMSIGLLFTLTIYVQRLYGPIVSLGSSYISIKNTMPIIDKIYSVLNTNNIIADGNIALDRNIRGALEFKNLDFSYEINSNANVLRNINFKVEPGTVLGIIGENGSGKTTLLKLLMRVCTSQTGDILLDGQRINNYQLEYFHSQFAYLLQNPYMMSGNLRDILNPLHNDIKDIEINEMINYFELDISKFENGLDTEIGENKLNISGGEAQKISLIRLFLENKPFYILDEPTAAIDIESEELICKKLKELLSGKTAIIITHREKILEICDEIYRL